VATIQATPPVVEQKAVSVEEAARKLGISKPLAKRLVAAGEIPSLKLGARRLVPVAAIDRLIDDALAARDA
jgi:excisionase family DNA binding protein